VTNNKGTNATSTPRFQVVGTPTVTDVSPSSGMDNVSTPVTVTGTNFVSVSGVALDDPGVTPLGTLNVVDDTTLTAVVPSGITPGLYNVQVTNPVGTNLTSAVQFQVTSSATPPPTVTAITPTSGSDATATPVTIDGTNFIGTVTARLDDPGTTAMTGVVVVSPTQITAEVPAGIALGTWEVRVTADGGTSPVAGVTFDVVSLYTGPAIYIAIGDNDEVMVVNLTTRLVEFSIPVGDLPSDLALSPDESTIYVTNTTSGTVSVIDTASNTVVDTIPVGAAPAAVDFDLTATEAYVANSGEPTVSVIDVASGMETQRVTVAAGPGELELRRPQGNEIWVLTSGTIDSNPDDVDVIDVVSKTVTNIPTDGITPIGITFNQAGDVAYVTNTGNIQAFVMGDVSQIDAVAKTFTQSIDLNPPNGSFPFEIARVPGADKAYVNDIFPGDTIIIFDTSSGTPTGSIGSLTGGTSVPWGRFGFSPANNQAFGMTAAGLALPFSYVLHTIDTSTDLPVAPTLPLGSFYDPAGSIVVKES
jgi:YVTN family beta-propeller protein